MKQRFAGIVEFFKGLSRKELIVFICIGTLLLASISVITVLLVSKPKQLDTPVLTIEADIASWEPDSRADKYELNIDGNISYLEKNVSSKKLEKGQTLKIKAIGNGRKYADSEWSNSVTCTVSNVKYTVTWKNGESVIEVDKDVLSGTVPTYDGETPTKASDAKYNYTFYGWTPEVTAVEEDVIYTALFTSEIRKYTVTWKCGDTVLEVDENVEYGTIPEYHGKTPEKAADIQYIYSFSGWSPDISEVVGNITYHAQFIKQENFYEIVWKNGDTVLEIDENVPYGSTPVYNGEVPAKESTAQYAYTFKGWTPKINNVTENITYYAEFEESIRSYSVKFYSDDGSVLLDEVRVQYGSDAAYTKSNPVKNPTAGYTYLFDKWVDADGEEDDLKNVVADRVVYASFTSYTRNVNVYIVPNNSEYGSVSDSVLRQIPYGSPIEIDGNTIKIGNNTVTAEAKIETSQYTYTFMGWSAGATVESDMTITANFSRTLRTYNVTWMNGGIVLEIDSNIPYGTTPVYNGEVPTKASEGGIEYVFSGWEPAVSTLTGHITYMAQFTNSSGMKVVIFYDDDGITELGRVVVESGEDVFYPNSSPTKEGDGQVAYLFEKWVTEKGGDTEASLNDVTDNMSVYAKYKTVAQTYSVTFCDYDGTILLIINIESGGTAEASISPERIGYRFDGWDKTLHNVTSDLNVIARYVKQFAVEFVDYDGSIIEVVLVDKNGTATPPSNPTRENYRFTGWNGNYTDVADDITVKAEYIRQYKVTFVDVDNTVLKEYFVDNGKSAEAPSDPTQSGYDFIGWDSAYNEIIRDTVVKATYKLKTYTVRFEMPDGTPIGGSYCMFCKEYCQSTEVQDGRCPDCDNLIATVFEQTVENGFAATAPEYPALYATSEEVFEFTGWSCSFDSVIGDLVVTALYETVYKRPAVIVEFSKTENGPTKLYIYSHSSVVLDAINITVGYVAPVGNIKIDKVEFNSASPFWTEDKDGNNSNQYVVNNNEKLFTFAWSDANGALDSNKTPYKGLSQVITFTYSTDLGAVIDENSFVIKECEAVIDGDKLENIDLLVIYR